MPDEAERNPTGEELRDTIGSHCGSREAGDCFAQRTPRAQVLEGLRLGFVDRLGHHLEVDAIDQDRLVLASKIEIDRFSLLMTRLAQREYRPLGTNHLRSGLNIDPRTLPALRVPWDALSQVGGSSRFGIKRILAPCR